MTEKELHRLNRRELLQLMLAQSEELAEVRAQYEKTEEERKLLEDERTKCRIELTEAGNNAEAALRLNGIFAAAQKAADQYLENIRLLWVSGGKLPEEEAEDLAEAEESENSEEANGSGESGNSEKPEGTEQSKEAEAAAESL